LIDQKGGSQQVGLVIGSGIIWAFDLESVSIGEELRSETTPDLADLRLGRGRYVLSALRSRSNQSRVVVATWRVQIERNPAVAAALGADVDALTTTASRLMDIVDGLRICSVDGELGQAAPELLLDSPQHLALGIGCDDLLETAALAWRSRATEWALEFQDGREVVIDVLRVLVGSHDQPGVPPTVGAAAETHTAA